MRIQAISVPVTIRAAFLKTLVNRRDKPLEENERPLSMRACLSAGLASFSPDGIARRVQPVPSNGTVVGRIVRAYSPREPRRTPDGDLTCSAMRLMDAAIARMMARLPVA